jgi:hypothetical protein
MKEFILVVGIFFFIVLFASAPRKDSEIYQLKSALAQQQGARAAELANDESKASMYLACKTFFNLCSTEINVNGERLLKNGFIGSTSIWYWLGLLGKLVCISVPLGAFCAVLIVVYERLHLWLIEPKRVFVEGIINFVDTAEARVKAANLRANDIEKDNGVKRREKHAHTHPPKIKIQSVVKPTLLIATKKAPPEPPPKPQPKREEDF